MRTYMEAGQFHAGEDETADGGRDARKPLIGTKWVSLKEGGRSPNGAVHNRQAVGNTRNLLGRDVNLDQIGVEPCGKIDLAVTHAVEPGYRAESRSDQF